MIIEYVHTRNKNSNSERDVPQCGDRRKKINVKVIRDKKKKKERKKKIENKNEKMKTAENSLEFALTIIRLST